MSSGLAKLTAIQEASAIGGNRCTSRTVQVVDFQKGLEAALQDRPQWLTECIRVVDHISGGRGLPAKNWIVHLRLAWAPDLPGDAGRTGEPIRLDQGAAEYKRLEVIGDYEGCLAYLNRS